MKTKIILIVFAVIMTACVNKKSRQQAADPAAQMLVEFYTAYITESAKMPPEFNPQAIEDLKNKYTTEEFRKRWKDAELEYDPILNAQESDTGWIKTLETKSVPGQKDVYVVCYHYNKTHENCITLHLVDRNGKYLVNDIESVEAATYPQKTFVIDGKTFSVFVKDETCLCIRNEKDELIFEKCDEYWMLQLHDQKIKNTLPLTIISGKHAIDADFRYTDFRWKADTVTYYPPGKSVQTLKMSVVLADFDFDKIIAEYRNSLDE